MVVVSKRAALLLFLLQIAGWPSIVLSNDKVEEQKDTLQDSMLASTIRGAGEGRSPSPPRFSKNCPPDGFDARPTLDLDSYISKVWYVQKAAPVIYAMDQSYCSVAAYSKDDSCKFLCGDQPRIKVENRGREDSVTGPVNEPADIPAFVPDPDNDPAKLRVSPPQRFTKITNYWVVAAGTYQNITNGVAYDEDNDNYEWALISGAEPFRESNGKCAPGFGQFDTRGLWIFARDPEPPSEAIDAIEEYAEGLGLDTSIMIKVIHDPACDYEDFCDRCD